MKFQTKKSRREQFQRQVRLALVATFVLLLFFTSQILQVKAMGQKTRKAYVKVASTLNVRDKPSIDAKIIAKLEPGDIVTILSSEIWNEEKEEWIKIQTEQEEIGYVSSQFLVEPQVDIDEYELLSVAVITKKDGSSENRNFNMQKATEAINGLVLEPEDVFAWYDTEYEKKEIPGVVGPANKINGYKKAPILLGGRSAFGYGGGVCQVSTTLYNTILKIEIEPTEIHHHSKPSSYVKRGMDATVTYPSKNFVFVNTKEYAIKIEAYTDGPQVIIALYKVY